MPVTMAVGLWIRQAGTPSRTVSHRSKLATHFLAPLAVLVPGAALRLAAQEGIPLYPDSYQFMLLARELTDSLPIEASLGAGGDSWAIPFHRLGYGFVAAPLTLVSNEPFSAGLIVSFVAGLGTVVMMYFLAGLAFRSWWAASLAATVTAISFSAIAWSRFPMSEALGMYLLAQTMLLGVAAGQSGRLPVAIGAGVSAAMMAFVRLDLMLALPTLGLLLYYSGPDGDRPPLLPVTLGISLGVSLLGLAALAALLAGDAVEGFSLNPIFLAKTAFASPAGRSALTGSNFGAGPWDFITRDPILAMGAVVGSLAAIRTGERKTLAVLPALLALLAVYTAWNDMRHFALLVPLLAYLTGFGLYEVGKGAIETLRGGSRSLSLAVAALAGFAGMTFIATQVHISESSSHPDSAYEYEVARGVESHLKEIGPQERLVLCSYSPEALYIVTGLSVKRLSGPDLDSCGLSVSPRSRVLVLIDEPVRSKFGESLSGQLLANSTKLFTIVTEAPWLDGRSIDYDTDPVEVYLVLPPEGAD